MSQQLRIPEPLWNTIPADAQAALLAAWKAMEDRIDDLEAIVRNLQARLQLNSTDSSKPPSSDPIGLKRRPPAPPSSWKRGGQPGHRKAFMAFTIARNRTARVAMAVLGTQDGSIAVTDRCGSYDWIAAASRQVCWSHLRRDFQAMIDRGRAAEPIGKKLLRLSDRLFRGWHRLEAETVDRWRFRTAMARLRREVKTALEEGVRCRCARQG